MLVTAFWIIWRKPGQNGDGGIIGDRRHR